MVAIYLEVLKLYSKIEKLSELYKLKENQYLPFNKDYLSMANENDFPKIYFLEQGNRVYSYPHPLMGDWGKYQNMNELQSVANSIMSQRYPQQYQQLQNYLNQINGR